jgi:Phosphotransferase enzyme family
LRTTPPPDVRAALTGAAPGSGWTVDRLGDGWDGYPNGGLWRVTAASRDGTGPFQAVVKRTGGNHLGHSKVWRCRFDRDDPQWWGREAAFYGSDLARSGWTGGVRAASCYAIDDHDDCRDLWLETVDIPATLSVYAQAASGLARWQVAHTNNADTDKAGNTDDWLARGWIPTHVSRFGLDNERTLAHPAWPAAIGRGLDPDLRDLVKERVTDPTEIRDRLREFPQVLTHHDFHHGNVGTIGKDVVIIDWAFVGWGPIGHDAGHLALDVVADLGDVSQVWQVMQSAYCAGLEEAGWQGDLSVVRRSMVVSNKLRLGWNIDHVLSVADQVSDDDLAAMSTRLSFLANLHEQFASSGPGHPTR